MSDFYDADVLLWSEPAGCAVAAPRDRTFSKDSANEEQSLFPQCCLPGALTTWWRGDLARTAHLRDLLREAYNSVARLSFDCTEWPTDGYDQRETLRTLRDLMPPTEMSTATRQEWHDRALELLAAGDSHE